MAQHVRACAAGNYTCGGLIHNGVDGYCAEHRRRAQQTHSWRRRRTHPSVDGIDDLLDRLRAHAQSAAPTHR